MTETAQKDAQIDALFKVGAHFGYPRSRRHPSVAPFIFGAKNRVEIIDLEKVKEFFDKASGFVEELGAESKTILWVGGKSEASDAITSAASSLGQPFVSGRWIGGTLSNFKQIRGRVEELLKLREQKIAGELSVYTKKERLLIDRKIEKLDRLFSGLVPLRELPKALIVVDSEREKGAVEEAQKARIPVIALLGSDCDLSAVTYPILANDASRMSIAYFLNALAESYTKGKKKGALSVASSSAVIPETV